MATIATRSPTLPLDLVECIIDELRADRGSLKSCSLTSRLWTHHARTHLHHSFTLEQSTTGVTSAQRYRHYEALDDLPSILQYADEVHFEYVPCQRGSMDETLCSAQFRSIVNRLGHIRKIRIRGGDFACQSPMCVDTLRWGELFPAVEELALFGTTVLDASDPILLASQFPKLLSLTLEHVDIRPGTGGFSLKHGGRDRVVSLALRSLQVDCHDKPEFLRTLLRLSTCHRDGNGGLRTLQFSTTLGVEESTDLRIFFGADAATLRDLHLVLQENPEYPEFPSNIRAEVLQRASQCIESCENLDVLRLGYRRHFSLSMIAVVYGQQKGTLSSVWEIWAKILAGLENISFRRLVFYVDARDIDCRDALEHVLLTRHTLHTVQVVCFYVGGNFASMARMRHAVAKWRGALRRLTSQYIVRLEFYHKTEVIRDGWYIW